MNENEKDITAGPREDYLDAAAIDALGAATPAEAENFRQQSATVEEQKTARQLRETVARMAAASPYMEPSSNLKAKIMTASAPANFKLSDYKKANSDAKWWRYGLVAAILFLVWAAYYNINLENKFKAQTAQLIRLQDAIKDQNTALSMIADPKTQKAALKIGDKATAAVLLDEEKGIAVVVAPASAFPAGKVPQLQITRSGVNKAYRTIPIVVNDLGDAGSEMASGKSIEMHVLKPDEQAQPSSASFPLR